MAREESMFAEVVRVYKRKPKAGEPGKDFLLAILKKMNADEEDEKWNQLREATQTWLNDRMLEDNDKAGEFAALLEPDEVVSKGVSATAPKERAAKDAGADEPGSEQSEPPENEENGVMPKAAAKKTAAKKTTAKSTERRKVQASNGTGRGRQGAYPRDAKISLLTKENPKREGSASYKRFEKYKNNMTVQQALDAGLEWPDFRSDQAHGYIAIK